MSNQWEYWFLVSLTYQVSSFQQNEMYQLTCLVSCTNCSQIYLAASQPPKGSCSCALSLFTGTQPTFRSLHRYLKELKCIDLKASDSLVLSCYFIKLSTQVCEGDYTFINWVAILAHYTRILHLFFYDAVGTAYWLLTGDTDSTSIVTLLYCDNRQENSQKLAFA